MKIKDVMTSKELQFCTPETKIHNAAKIMKKTNCGALPVVNKEKKVVGIITDRDIALSLAEKKNDKTNTVEHVMSSDVKTINANEDLSQAFKEMSSNKIGRLPVVDNKGKLNGIISLHGLLNQSIDEKTEKLSNLSLSGENILKTVKAITGRYNGNSTKKGNELKKKNNKIHAEELVR